MIKKQVVRIVKRKLLAIVMCTAMLLASCGESSQGDSQQETVTTTTQLTTTTEVTTATTTTTTSVTTSATTASPTATTTAATTAPTVKKDKVTEMLGQMTLEEKIAQLFIVRADALETDKKQSGGVTVCDDSVKANLKQYPVGGVIYFANNVKDPTQLTKLSGELQAASKYPLFVTTDEEGGSVTRIARDSDFKVKKYTSMLAVGNSGDVKLASEVGQTIGKYLKDYGLNLDLAPVADIYSNPLNKVIGSRAFGSDANNVSFMVNACVKGFHEQGMMTCLKHFPGHGDTASDSHYGAAVVNKTWNELTQRELIPFVSSLKDTDMVMAAHISLPKVTGDNTPASLSKIIITDKLRNELGYDGVVITDSLGMGAVTKSCTAAEAPVKALEAGCDILLTPPSLPVAYKGVLDAVKSGRLSEQRIDESVRRILTLKNKYALI